MQNMDWSSCVARVFVQRRSHKDLIVWQKALALADSVHRITGNFPKHELFGLTSQIRRAAVSIPSNIAEGAARGTTREFIHFLHTARGSFAELETQLHLARRFGYLANLEPISMQLDEVGRLLNAVIRGLHKKVSEKKERKNP
jgi:four helix bundle protein